MKDNPILDYERRPPPAEQGPREWSPLMVSIFAVVFAGITFLGGARARRLQEHYNAWQLFSLPSIAFFIGAVLRASREVWRGRTNPKTIAAFGLCALCLIVITTYLVIYGNDG
jgi:hypothetical protein